MADLSTRMKLGSLGKAREGTSAPTGQVADFQGIDYDMLTRRGIRAALQIDRTSWESLGRPVDITVTVESEHEAYVTDVLRELAVERAHQEEEGYDAAHDDAHGLQHILDQARKRIAPGQLYTRDDLVEAAAVLVAAVEWMDRVTPPYPSEDLSVPQRL